MAGEIPADLGLHEQTIYAYAQHKALTMSTATTTEVIAAPGAGKRIYIVDIFIQSEGTCDVTLLTASTAMTGVIGFTNLDTFTGHRFRCGENEAFNITTGHAIQINGFVTYVVK